MAIKQKFFSSAQLSFPALPTQKDAPSGYVDVEGPGDYGFRALAAALIELVLLHPLMEGKDALLEVLVSRYEEFFQPCKTSIVGSPASQRWLQLLKRVPLSQFIPDLGYVLRQIAVDELCANPAIYPDAFIAAKIPIAVSLMRKANALIDACAIAALSNRLCLPITINTIDGCMTLPKQLKYNVDGIRPSLIIQLNNGRYMPYLRTLSTQIGRNMIWSMSAINHTPIVERRMDDILRDISDDRMNIKQQFLSIYNDLKLQVSRATLTKADLIAIYVSGADRCRNLKDLRHSAGLEVGTQRFFETMIATENSATNEVVSSHDEYIIRELILAIARAISLGYMSPSVIYKDNMESTTRAFREPTGP